MAGALASIDVRTGRFVDRIVLRRHHTSTTGTGSYSSPTDALSGGSSIGKNEGGALSGGSSTGKNEEPVETSFELHSAEAVIGVCHWSSADYLGSQIEIITSEGRTCMFKGSRSSRCVCGHGHGHLGMGMRIGMRRGIGMRSVI